MQANLIPCQYFSPQSHQDMNRYIHQLEQLLTEPMSNRPLLFLCIGTDRATGDCLGPLIGEILSERLEKKAIVYGTLRHPVHAGNLTQILSDIHNRYSNPYIIAIDASLGIHNHVGWVTLGAGSLRPGIGVQHALPETGDIHITGIVNVSNHQNQLNLQTTHLYTVMKLSRFISHGILKALHVRSPF